MVIEKKKNFKIFQTVGFVVECPHIGFCKFCIIVHVLLFMSAAPRMAMAMPRWRPSTAAAASASTMVVSLVSGHHRLIEMRRTRRRRRRVGIAKPVAQRHPRHEMGTELTAHHPPRKPPLGEREDG